jgi:hypothetical protein
MQEILRDKINKQFTERESDGLLPAGLSFPVSLAYQSYACQFPNDRVFWPHIRTQVLGTQC